MLTQSVQYMAELCLVFSASLKANDSEEMISNTYYLLNKAENWGAFPIPAWSKD